MMCVLSNRESLTSSLLTHQAHVEVGAVAAALGAIRAERLLARLEPRLAKLFHLDRLR
jgi:hypothetical protein